jgi:hypothetical protein
MVAAAGQVLWHVSDRPGIGRFEPRAVEHHDSGEALVWAIDDDHVPAYWFPRDVPRGTWWANAQTTDADVERFLGAAPRVHAIQREWVDEFRAGRIYAYRLPPETFAPYDDVAGYWVSRDAVEPLEVLELDDLPRLHAERGIELRVVDDLAAVWDEVIASTVAFSGIRLRNLARRT